MRRALLAAGVAVLGLGLVSAAVGSERAALTTVSVRNGAPADEFALVLSRRAVPPGKARIQFQNGGEDPHDMNVRRVGGGKRWGTGRIGPGLTGDMTNVKLRPRSRYRLWCSLENHVSYGMEATLRVKAKKRR